ncbi:MAG: STAS domain-containing protein [Desulfuromonadales bacterium]|nr:STAS domain-containing protein [Desulfuromonadales bacterium]
MTNWSFDAENDAGTLLVEGDMTINHIGDLKKRLVEAFDSAERVTVDVSSATAVDVAGIQLLCACHRFSSGRGKKMCLRLGENAKFAQFLDEVGFTKDFICNHGDANECLWTPVT